MKYISLQISRIIEFPLEDENKKKPCSARLARDMYGDLNRVRTCDPHPVKMVLSQLSYQIISRSDKSYNTKVE
jgi:hypothetical protein